MGEMVREDDKVHKERGRRRAKGNSRELERR